MPKLWLTYAWKDNEEHDVDFVANRIQEQGINVRIDRTQLLSGRRLWEQIGANISAPELDGWAIYVTEESLRSEPCQEELAYALDRALRTKGTHFPLIGIFPTPVERELIPSSIAVRLWVHLKDNEWSQRVAEGLIGLNTQKIKEVEAVEIIKHYVDTSTIFEIRPREGNWYPADVVVPEQEFHKFKFAWRGPRGASSISPAMFEYSETEGILADSRWKGWRVQNQIDSTCALYASFKSEPSKIAVGPSNGTHYIIEWDLQQKRKKID